MCESITTDLDDSEFARNQERKAANKKTMVQHSNTRDLDDAFGGEVLDSMTSRQPGEVSDSGESSYSAEVANMIPCESSFADIWKSLPGHSSSDPDSVTSNDPRDSVDFDSDWEVLTHGLLGNYEPVSGEVVDLVDDQLDSCSTSEALQHSSNPVPERVLEQVADRLRIIGDEMDSDIRRNRMLNGRHRDQGFPVRGYDVIVDLFPVSRSTSSRKKLTSAAGDLVSCETLARDLVHVTVRRALVAAGSAFAHALFRELVSSTVTCPVDFRMKWSAIKWSRWS